MNQQSDSEPNGQVDIEAYKRNLRETVDWSKDRGVMTVTLWTADLDALLAHLERLEGVVQVCDRALVTTLGAINQQEALPEALLTAAGVGADRLLASDEARTGEDLCLDAMQRLNDLFPATPPAASSEEGGE